MNFLIFYFEWMFLGEFSSSDFFTFEDTHLWSKIARVCPPKVHRQVEDLAGSKVHMNSYT